MKSRQELRAVAQAQVSAGDYVPYGTHVAADVVKMLDGSYIACWRVEGIAFETADHDEIAARKEGLVNYLRALGGGRWGIYSHKVRRPVRERLSGVYGNAFCADLAKRYYDSFETHRQMATELYLTLVYKPERSRVTSLFRKAARNLDEIRAAEQEDLDAVDDAAKQLQASLVRYNPERLSSFSKGSIVHSEMLGFLGYLLNGVWEDVAMRRASIAEYLPTSRLFFGDKNGMVEMRHPTGTKFAGFLDIQEYPRASEPGMCNVILYGDYEYVETQSFAILNKRVALEALKQQKGVLEAGEQASPTEIREMDQAMDEVHSGAIEIGEYHFSLAVFGESPAAVAKNMAEARAALQDGPGFKMSVVDVIPECAWFAQLPGNWKLRPREAKITSRNFACLSPLHNFARGKAKGNPWGEALALMKTPSAQPYYLNFHASPDDADSTDEKYPGNTFICGATGSGKTVLEMSLLAFATKYRGMRAVFFDKDRGAEIGIRAMGGRYFALKRGVPTGFNPFQLPPTEANIQFCERLIRLLVRTTGAAGDTLTAKDESDISQAVRTVMSDKVSFDLRRLSTVSQSLPVTGDNSLRARLRKWTLNMPLGWVFDNARDTQDFEGATLFGYDYTEFLDDPEVRTPIMAYLLHITETLINGEPFIYFMEEFWKPLMDETFSDFALNKQKTIRKQSGLGVFVTQSPSDVLVHRIGRTMVEQSVTQIFLPNPRADHGDYVGGFKVTEAEFAIIRNLGESSRMFLIKQGHRSAIVKFDLQGMGDILNVLSGSTDNVELLDLVRADVGDAPEDWMPELHKRIAARRKVGR